MRSPRILAAALLLASATAMAGPTMGYRSTLTDDGITDHKLTQAALDAALIAGMNSAGGDVKRPTPGLPAVEVHMMSVFRPELSGLRSVSYLIQLRDEVTYKGKGAAVIVCGFSTGMANHGASKDEGARIEAILKNAHVLGARFAADCLK